jgi:2-polyprenyl-6-hydroxyphenyl methylase/3-demethylubiquinone-9 3-methyltransferase
MNNYYTDNLAAERLKQCYEIAPDRVQQYLNAEVNFVCDSLNQTDLVLELGCGFGRIIPQLAKNAKYVIGIDTSYSSLIMATDMLKDFSNVSLQQMNALNLAFPDQSFDVVVCIQNGISAFHVDKVQLIQESIRVTKIGGTILYSSYSDKFWEDRLEWFHLQEEAGLLGKIDAGRTKNGEIVCEDGFTARTIHPDEFLSLSSRFNVKTKIVEVDNSSVFCEMVRL